MVTKEQLKEYYEKHLEELVDWDDDIDEICLFAYLDGDDNLYCGINQLSYTQFRVPIQAEVTAGDDWNYDFFNNPSDYDGWDETLEEMLDKLNEFISE